MTKTFSDGTLNTIRMLNDTDLTQIAAKLGSLKDSATSGRAATIASVAFTAAEVNFGAALAGFVNGRFQTPGKDHFSVAGLPADLVAGAAGLGASLLGSFQMLDTHVGAVSAGIVSAYVYRTAFAYGAAATDKAAVEKQKLVEKAQAQLAQGSTNVVRMSRQAALAGVTG